MRVVDIDFSDILWNEKSYKTYENIFIYDISYKTFMDAKPLRILFEKMFCFKIYDGTVYLVLFGLERLDILLAKKLVLQILLAIILQESESIHIILYM